MALWQEEGGERLRPGRGGTLADLEAAGEVLDEEEGHRRGRAFRGGDAGSLDAYNVSSCPTHHLNLHAMSISAWGTLRCFGRPS